MKTASVTELRQNFKRLLACIEDGQEIQITVHQKRIRGCIKTLTPDISLTCRSVIERFYGRLPEPRLQPVCLDPHNRKLTMSPEWRLPMKLA
jgi:hypothetical protein